jgi:hypothetical protein
VRHGRWPRSPTGESPVTELQIPVWDEISTERLEPPVTGRLSEKQTLTLVVV